MPLTTAQKKALADAEALLAKKKAELAALESEQAKLGSSVTNQVSNVDYPTAGLQTTLDPFAPKQENESNADYMQRVTQAYKDQPQPTLNAAQIAAGAQVQFVRTGAAGEGKYEIVYPIGVQFDKATGQPIIDPNTGKAKNAFLPSTSPTTVGKTIVSSSKDEDGNTIVKYSDGSTKIIDANGNPSSTKSLTTTTSSTPTALKTDAQIAAETATAKAQGERQSAYDLLYSEFQKYGLESLVAPLKGLIISGASPAEFTIKLRETPEYQKRFAGNAQRIANGLTAIDEATYLAKEDAYQNLMRNYGLPDTYWKKGALGTQDGFTKLIANDVSAVELENRLQTAQQRVSKANPEVAYALKAFYPDITNGDILAYALDPKNALDAINRKVTAAEIGGAALSQGLTTSLGGAEGLAAYGITKDQAQQGYQTIAGMLPRGSQLADIYGQQPYNQGVAEAEVFGTQGAAEAKKRREKLVSLETAQFGGSSGVGALGRDKGIYGATQGQSGQY